MQHENITFTYQVNMLTGMQHIPYILQHIVLFDVLMYTPPIQFILLRYKLMDLV